MNLLKKLFNGIKISHCLLSVAGSVILAFGLYNIHAQSGVTEGGVLGLTLLLYRHFNLSPAVSGAVLNIICYVIGFKTLGRKFIIYSAISTVGFSSSYAVCELFEPLWKNAYEMPFVAAIAGAIFVGVGVGICVRIGGAPSGDDALAMSLSHITKLNISWIYLITDIIVLGLSVTYIPITRLVFSLITVVLSGQIIGFIQKYKRSL